MLSICCNVQHHHSMKLRTSYMSFKKLQLKENWQMKHIFFKGQDNVQVKKIFFL